MCASCTLCHVPRLPGMSWEKFIARIPRPGAGPGRVAARQRSLASIVASFVVTMSSFVAIELGCLRTRGLLSSCMLALPCLQHCLYVQCPVAIGISGLRPTPVAKENPLSRQRTNILFCDREFSVVIDTRKWAVAHFGPLHLRFPFSFLSKTP